MRQMLIPGIKLSWHLCLKAPVQHSIRFWKAEIKTKVPRAPALDGLQQIKSQAN